MNYIAYIRVPEAHAERQSTFWWHVHLYILKTPK